ncbi:MAG: hypothetical protein KJO78_06860, partial [Alphaproteobacteria bacterium]|nr:hypothetical protein [Alphaproteobacteria bacterium]
LQVDTDAKGSDFPHRFEDPERDADLMQRQAKGQPGDTGAGDQDGHCARPAIGMIEDCPAAATAG